MSLQPQTRTDESMVLPADVRLMQLKTHPDQRGELTEIFRNEWHDSPPPVRWVACRNGANVLRGVHVHANHWDYLSAVGGEVFIGLHDLRPEKPAARRSAMIRLDSRHPQILLIPPGVGYGFYSPADSMILAGSSGYHEPPDDLRCRWDSPELALEWPGTAPQLSPPDRDAGNYTDLRAALLSLKVPRAKPGSAW